MTTIIPPINYANALELSNNLNKAFYNLVNEIRVYDEVKDNIYDKTIYWYQDILRQKETEFVDILHRHINNINNEEILTAFSTLQLRSPWRHYRRTLK